MIHWHRIEIYQPVEDDEAFRSMQMLGGAVLFAASLFFVWAAIWALTI